MTSKTLPTKLSTCALDHPKFRVKGPMVSPLIIDTGSKAVFSSFVITLYHDPTARSRLCLLSSQVSQNGKGYSCSTTSTKPAASNKCLASGHAIGLFGVASCMSCHHLLMGESRDRVPSSQRGVRSTSKSSTCPVFGRRYLAKNVNSCRRADHRRFTVPFDLLEESWPARDTSTEFSSVDQVKRIASKAPVWCFKVERAGWVGVWRSPSEISTFTVHDCQQLMFCELRGDSTANTHTG